MILHRIKYIAAFILPVLTIFSFLQGGWFYWLPIVYAFILVPIFDALIPLNEDNLTKSQEIKVKKEWWFTFLLLMILPVHCYVLYLFLQIEFSLLDGFQLIGAIFSAGLSCGVLGINVGHELGHKNDLVSKVFAHLLLLSSLYMHFYIEHNYGHHKNVATKEDPATARRNETVYAFWMRSIFYSYLSAWSIQLTLLREKKFFSWNNNMLIYHIAESLLLLFIYFVFGFDALLFFLLVTAVGILLLETVNYIEHYGLMRNKEKGFYERTTYAHSWNSNHVFGRLVLFDLSRHSDHHYKSTRPYHILRYHEESPQLPGGYPAMMLLALLPPFWFKVIHKRIQDFQTKSSHC